jgi:FtsH-binding integral membrane protein
MRTTMVKLTQLIENPDGTLSTKRTVGLFCLLVALAFAIWAMLWPVDSHLFSMIFFGFLGLAGTSLGLTSLDYLTDKAAGAKPPAQVVD